MEFPLNSEAPATQVPLTIDDLGIPFEAASKPRAEYRVGTEAEKVGVRMANNTPVAIAFAGSDGVQAVLERLTTYGYTAYREVAGGEVIALQRDQASITLEPAAQLELSGAPFASVHQTAREMESHISDLRAVSEPLGIYWLSIGFHPFATHAQLPHVPKLRYGIMERYMPTRGARSLDMMRRTCTVQVNLDYSSSSDAMRKLRVALALQPIATAMFANSPFYEGHRGRYLSERAHVWCHMDPDRSGLLPFAWDRASTLHDYIEWALDVPMFLVKRGDTIIENTQQTFRTFMKEGRHGTRAMASDWDTHLNTLFPEVRLKKTLEVRGADAQPTNMVCSVTALWKGLLYDETALNQAESLVSAWGPDEAQAAREIIAEKALKATLAGKPILHWAQQVVDIAENGLRRLGQDPAIEGSGEEIYLQPLQELLSQNQTPAEALLQRLGASPSAADIIKETCVWST